VIAEKWQFFLGGILSGLLISGILMLLINKPISPAPKIITETPSISSNSQTKVTPPSYFEGKININKASAEELSLLPSIGMVKANAIIDYREKYGPFAEIDELLYVPGIGESLLTTIREYVYVEE
jgi:competence protein ComEA